MKRLTRLDGLRGVLAVYVMIGHAMPFVVLPGWAKAPFSHGEAAVDLFFALSGLVILNSLEHFGYKFWPFFKARARRLLPVYFAVLGFDTIVLLCGSPMSIMPWITHSQAARQTWAMDPPHPLFWHIAAHVLLVQGMIPQGVLPYVWISLLGPAWSLSTEWQFYIFIALMLPLLGLRNFTFLLLGMGVAYHVVTPHLPDYWRFSRAFLPDAAAYFALGLGAALWLRGGGAWLLVVCIVVAAGLGFDSAAASRALIPLGWALMIAVQRREGFPVLGRLLDSRMAQYMGAISYPLYLLNEPVQRAMALMVAPLCGGDQRVFTMVWLPLAMAAPIAAAVVLHHGVEKRFMRAGSVKDKNKALLFVNKKKQKNFFTLGHRCFHRHGPD